MPTPKKKPDNAPEKPPSLPAKVAPKPPAGKKAGGQQGNLNAITTGARMRRLVMGELPKTMKAVQKEGSEYRIELEAEVLKEKGEISYSDAHRIDTAVAATLAGGVCRWILRQRVKDMTASEILNCIDKYWKSKERRDAAVMALKLDSPPESPWVIIQEQ